MTALRHVLFDADGVVQRVGGDGWRAKIRAHLGERTEEFVDSLWEVEEPALSGKGDFPAGLVPVLRAFDVPLDPDAFYAGVWLDIETVSTTVALAEQLRRDGLAVHLATNQHRERADHMKRSFGYGDVFGDRFYSCDLGAAKPAAEFFTLVCERLDAAPAEVLLIDDSAANVDAALLVGLEAVRWHHDDGHDELVRLLAAYGL